MTWMEVGSVWLLVGVLLAEAIRATTLRADPTSSDDMGSYAIVAMLWPFLVIHLAIYALLTGKLPGK